MSARPLHEQGDRFNKNAFQSDAYRPLVDRMLESASRGGGSPSRGVPPSGGVPPSQGGSLHPGGGSPSGGVLHPGGFSMRGVWHPSMH